MKFGLSMSLEKSSEAGRIYLMYLNLTTHSAYTLLEGLPLPAELAQAAKTGGMIALGLTDHRTLTGAIEFVHACHQAEIQPVLGLEIDLETGRLPLLASSVETLIFGDKKTTSHQTLL